jgi:hypothetical protein
MSMSKTGNRHDALDRLILRTLVLGWGLPPGIHQVPRELALAIRKPLHAG